MKLGSRSGEVKIYSIEHLHSPEDNRRVVEAIWDDGREYTSRPCILAAAIEITRAHNDGVPIGHLAEQFCSSVKEMSRHLKWLMREGFVVARDDFLIVAPFRITWAKERPDLLIPQTESTHATASELRISDRPGPSRSIMDPRYISPSRRQARDRDDVEGMTGAWMGIPMAFFIKVDCCQCCRCR